MYRLVLTVQYISVIFIAVECCVVFRHWKSVLHSYLFMTCVATLVNNLGYLLQMRATSEDGFIAALQFAYLGKVWIPYSLFIFILLLCNVRVTDKIKLPFLSVPVITYFTVLTVKSNTLYYTSYQYVSTGLFPQIQHKNGVWHIIYDIILVVIISYGLLRLFLSWRKETNPTAKKRLFLVSLTVLSYSGSFGIYKAFPAWSYDVTVLGYTIGTLFMYIAIFRYDLLDMASLARQYVVDELSEGIIAVNAQRDIIFYNKPALSLFPELRDNPKIVMMTIRGAVNGGEPLHIQERIIKPEENKFSVNGPESGTVYSLVDVTEQYRHMDELKEQKRIADTANRAKSRFLANMSHEIRTPINAILGMDEMILRESGEDQILSYAGDIQSAGRTLLSIINDILDFSKIEEGKMEILPTQYELCSVINDLVNMMRPRAEKKGLRFIVKVDASTPHLLFGDEIRIRQCALNLLTNAVKYTETGSVTFSLGYEKLSDDKISLLVRVSDTGIGMKPEDMERLFSPFARIEESRNRAIEGTGLGMSITKKLLALMGSRLDVESVYGEGSTFSFAIEQPVMQWEKVGSFAGRYQSDAPRETYRELFHAPDARVLVVDDTPVNLTVIRGLLKKTRVQVVTADSGEEALRIAARESFDVFFIDHMMPEMDGIETLRSLRKLPGLENTPTIALTANAISGAREMYLEAGFSDYLSKPVDGEKLERLLMSHLPPEKLVSPQADAHAAAPPQRSDKATVLVVDDDPVICSLASDILGKSFRVESCQSGAETPQRSAALRPDLILLDINLGDTSGFDVLRTLRQNPATCDIPVVFLTGASDEEAEARGFRDGAADFVRKPFVPEVLLRRTGRIIALDRLQRDLQSEVRHQTLRAEHLTREMMLALSKAVDAKDHYTNGHSERVAAYSAEIARRMGKTPAEQAHIYEMGLLHDIGKIGVSEEIINKTSRLTDEEFEQIKRHTVVGSEILRLITEMPELSDGARSHHERYGGGGYPDGSKGTDIPEAARIICLADCYDAMTSTRTYSQPKEQAAVRAEIERCAGTQFDPDVAKVLLEMIDEDKDYIMTERTADIRIWKGSERLWTLTDDEDDAAAAQSLPEPDEPDEPEATLPDWLEGVPEIDTKTGLRHCGTAETYLDTLTIFAKNAAAGADEIERYWRSSDAANATVKVHALKSMSRTIGAEAMGALAEKLELAGKAGDTETLFGGVGALLERFRALGAALAPLYAPEAPDAPTEDDSLPLITDEELCEAYDGIRELAASLDAENAGFLLDSLKSYRIPEAERERVNALRRAIAEFDWDRVNEILS